jgi:hypothetical protein
LPIITSRIITSVIKASLLFGPNPPPFRFLCAELALIASSPPRRRTCLVSNDSSSLLPRALAPVTAWPPPPDYSSPVCFGIAHRIA